MGNETIEDISSISIKPQEMDEMNWWKELSDLDRLNVLNNPVEERARILASKISLSVEETMLEISRRSGFSLLDDFELSENPTKALPLRLIHSFCCLPIIYSS